MTDEQGHTALIQVQLPCLADLLIDQGKYNLDSPDERRRILADWEGNPVIQDALKGERSVRDAYTDIIDRYHQGQFNDDTLYYLSRVVGPLPLETNWDVMSSIPAGAGIGLGGGILGMAVISEILKMPVENRDYAPFSRRTFLKATALSTAAGFLIGLRDFELDTRDRSRVHEQAQENAQFIDTIISKIYKEKTS
ncbi:MAG: twin-arginine translocation signal domain-containing protein [Nanoarchaeota archaeon]